MQAKVTTKFNGVRDGECYPKTFQAGDIIEGELAEAAIGAGHAIPLAKRGDDSKMLDRAPRNKAERSSASRAGRR